MNNGQGAGDTETGAYTLLGGTATPSNGTSVTRNAGATIFLTSQDEWYKAAYYDPSSSSYLDYPAGSDEETTCATPTATANQANCDLVVGDLTPVGSYPGSASPYGTFDQGGNVGEWNEAGGDPSPYRGVRGGQYGDEPNELAAAFQNADYPDRDGSGLGFRLAMIPEPGTGLLVIAGLLGLAGWRRARLPSR
jgi:formylglycine-generating enzyme required for sulfatase activity